MRVGGAYELMIEVFAGLKGEVTSRNRDEKFPVSCPSMQIQNLFARVYGKHPGAAQSFPLSRQAAPPVEQHKVGVVLG